MLVAILANGASAGCSWSPPALRRNLAAIVANGGYMPASAGRAAALGGSPDSSTYSNSIFVPDPALAPLTDIFALPAWVPFANVFSIGDVLIGIGIAIVIVVSDALEAGAVDTGARHAASPA